jgi:hypothetical protein
MSTDSPSVSGAESSACLLGGVGGDWVGSQVSLGGKGQDEEVARRWAHLWAFGWGGMPGLPIVGTEEISNVCWSSSSEPMGLVAEMNARVKGLVLVLLVEILAEPVKACSVLSSRENRPLLRLVESRTTVECQSGWGREADRGGGMGGQR